MALHPSVTHRTRARIKRTVMMFEADLEASEDTLNEKEAFEAFVNYVQTVGAEQLYRLSSSPLHNEAYMRFE